MITHGDVLDVLQGTPDEVYSGCFCDPPYGLSFMGKRWDHGVPSCEVWREVWRVLRPGAVLMAFGGSRTWHRLAVNIEDAGFEMFDTLMWLYGSGFPKSTAIDKMIDREAGAEREVVGYSANSNLGNHRNLNDDKWDGKPWNEVPITAPATDAARTWQGYGSSLKPAWEPCLLFRKPRRGTYAQTALQHGTGALNIDGCRVETNGESVTNHARSAQSAVSKGIYGNSKEQKTHQTNGQVLGRWPANVVLNDEAGRLLDAQSGELTSGKGGPARHSANNGTVAKGKQYEHVTMNYGDVGGASRFFYCAKSSRAERGEGNNHPCCKPLSLCEYLSKIILPPVEYRDDARLLVPFCGSGSEILGALRAGWLHVDGIDNEAGYIEIAERRIAHELSKLEQSEQQLRLI